MDIRLECACGVTMELEDTPVPTAELFLEQFTRHHPHTDEAALQLARVRAEEYRKFRKEQDSDGSSS